MERTLSMLGVSALAVVLTGCMGQTTRNAPIEVWPDMDRQPKYGPQQESPIFADRSASRRPVAGTVARGFLQEDDAFHTGVVNGQYIGRNPRPITSDLLKTGQARFNVYCSPCHDRTGSGQGMVPAHSQAWLPTNLNDDRVRQMNDGEIFNVMSYGRRSMPPYRFQVSEADRWAVVAYVRALQRTRGAMEDVPQEKRAELK